MQLQWKTSRTATGLHAAWLLQAGRPLVDAGLAAALAEPLSQFRAASESTGVEAGDMLEQMAGLAGIVDGQAALVQRTLTRIRGNRFKEETARGLIRAVSGLESATAAVLGGDRSSDLRAAPLRQQWEARGPGLLAIVGRRTEPALIGEQSAVVVVDPVGGGGGVAYLPSNVVRIEGVLANPHDELPEFVRLGWLLAQLNLDVPIHGESVPGQALPRLAALAMLAPTLAAAAELEAARLDRPTLELALRAWLAEPETHVGPLAAAIAQWWELYEAQAPRMAVALAALKRLVAEATPDTT